MGRGHGSLMTEENDQESVTTVLSGSERGCVADGQGPGQAAVYRLAGKAEGRARRPTGSGRFLKPQSQGRTGAGVEKVRGWGGSADTLETGSRIQE